MAVNDEYLTERVRKAGTYFFELETKLRGKGIEEVEVNDGKMIEAAGYAASVFADGFGKKVGKKLQKEGFKDFDLGSIIEGYTPTRLGAMCQSFNEGNRKFSLTWIHEARIACAALVNYTDILEKEQNKPTNH
jgi:hypothetical protein